ncbi:MAG TPA: DUF6537 domain-containing protein, partial [Xanthobacteraceae bacterium]|nr:DUF6537 domain-containing protein [Xanthobacteraceae bacterium]
ANIFIVGYAYQIGALPLSAEAIEKAIELNGEAVEMNKAAFGWGRVAAIDPAKVEALIKPPAELRDDVLKLSQSFEEMVTRRVEFLSQYQNAAYGEQYRKLVDMIVAAEAQKAPGKSGLADTVGRYLFKLMAYKDEYEVARLYSDGAFRKQVAAQFDGDNLRFEFHLAPPLLARHDRETGLPKKMSFGAWMMPAFGMLAKLRFLRGSAFDPFGYTLERKTERQLVQDYRSLLDEIAMRLNPENHHLAVALASIPEKIRGFGHVKARHLKAAKADEAVLLEQFRSGGAPLLKAAE